jgi:uncharacterized lipoprotein YddW (UPF0748 family)
VYLSAAVFPNWEEHAKTLGQDWKAWVGEGVVDFVCPMNYTEHGEKLASYLDRQRAWVGGAVPLVSGIGVYADGHPCPRPAALVEQIQIARQGQSRGFVIFNYSQALSRDYLPWLVKGATSMPTAFDWLPLGLRQGSHP